jgi:uncharacterized NAD-dependent epimerase/dehydratase family protein
MTATARRLKEEEGLNVLPGLHDYLSEDAELAAAAAARGVVLRDVRKPPPVSSLHFFSGKIEQVTALKVALLGTDSAVGKRTTAWLLVEALERRGLSAEMIGTSTRWSTTSSPARSSTRCGAPGTNAGPTRSSSRARGAS